MLRIEEPGGSAMPAQLIKASSRPKLVMHRSTSAFAVSSWSAAPAIPVARPPAEITASVASCTASGSRPLITTPAPRRASSSATARPMPRLPPTTTTPRPARRSRSLIGSPQSAQSSAGLSILEVTTRGVACFAS
ncbi:hypothetical protein MM1218R_02642 [Mycobacterium marinum]|nr:hypothetical protein MM1218R_02642 [Mycobacterium marinum]RFZ01914.1 hypothetical protein DE4381_05074 [Mycobacterium marinum]